MAKSPNVFRKKSEVWCGRDIILMCGGFGGPPGATPCGTTRLSLHIDRSLQHIQCFSRFVMSIKSSEL